MPDEPVFGFLNINKPLHITSHDVVARVRRAFGIRKVGHAGTLDPLATGVLVICLGSATRLSEYVMHSVKRYSAQVMFGISTTTYDQEGEIVARHDTSALTRAAVESALSAFVGDILQTPPMYSAIKQGGRKLYEMARAGETVELQPRPVHIERITLLDWQPPVATIDVVCNAGTYIRSLAQDVGTALGVGAHLSALARTQSGSFHLANAADFDALLADPHWRSHIVLPDAALQGWRQVRLDPRQADVVAHGGAIAYDSAAERELALANAPNGSLLAVMRAEDGMWVPQKVFWRG